MKRKITHIEKLANQMYDPKPELVSLVRHGANQTPFKVFKAEQAAQRGRIEGEFDMKKAEIAKAQFNIAQFADETAVKTFMEGHGFTDCTVLKTETGFEVPGAEADVFDGAELKTVQIADGAVFFLGKLKDGATGLEAAAEKTIAKAAYDFKGLNGTEIVKKYDYYLSAMSNGKTMAEVLADGQDGLVPGMWELNDAFYAALRNLVLAGEVAQVKTLCAEFGEMITAIATMMQNATADVQQKALNRPETADLQIEAKAETQTTETADAAQTEQKAEGTEAGGEPAAADAPAADPAPAEQAAAEEAAPGAEAAAAEQPAGEAAAAEKTEKQEGAAGEPSLAETIAAAVAAALAPAVKSITELGETVREMKSAQADTAARVDGLSEARQTRKSADADGVAPKAPATTTSANAKVAKKLARNALGFMQQETDA